MNGAVTAGRDLAVRGLWKSYGAGVHAVRDVSFDLHPGEFLTLLGPSGSGKTTTLLTVAGFETLDRGEICVDGRDIAALPPERRNFGVVFQGYALFPHMTVLDNVCFALRMRGMAGRERRRRGLAMIERVGLGPFASRLPRQLSGGQQQRVALARALVFEPDALLLDEPLGALDRKLREELQAEIKAIQKRVGISILFVTHDQEEAMSMSDRVAVMSEGGIVQLGTPSEVYLHPRTAFVAGFLGETNMVSGTFCGLENDLAVVRFGADAIGRARLPVNAGRPTAGSAVTVSLRPERLRMSPSQGFVTGVIEASTFLGRHTRCVVQTLHGPWVVSMADWSPATTLPPGTRVGLSWAAEDAQILAPPE